MAANPAGSKNPTGGRSPISPVGLGMVLKVMFFFPVEAGAAAFFAGAAFTGAAFFGAALFTARVAARDVVARSTETGAKAVAPAKRDARTASFMVVVVVVYGVRDVIQ